MAKGKTANLHTEFSSGPEDKISARVEKGKEKQYLEGIASDTTGIFEYIWKDNNEEI